MKFLKITLTTLSLALALALCSQHLYAAPENDLHGIASQKFKALREDLALTGGQKTRIRGIMKSHLTPIKSQWESGKAARETMRRASLDHGPGSPEAKAAANTLGDIARDRSLLIAKIAAEVRPILTDEQLKKFEKSRLEFESLIDTKLDAIP